MNKQLLTFWLVLIVCSSAVLAAAPVVNSITPLNNSVFFSSNETTVTVTATDSDGDTLGYNYLVRPGVVFQDTHWTSDNCTSSFTNGTGYETPFIPNECDMTSASGTFNRHVIPARITTDSITYLLGGDNPCSTGGTFMNMSAEIDGNVLGSIETGGTSDTRANFTSDISAYNDGGIHNLSFIARTNNACGAGTYHFYFWIPQYHDGSLNSSSWKSTNFLNTTSNTYVLNWENLESEVAPWTFQVNTSDGTGNSNLSVEHKISWANLDLCTNIREKGSTLNFTIKDEKTFTALTGEVSTALTLSDSTASNVDSKTYNYALDGSSSYVLCSEPMVVSPQVDDFVGYLPDDSDYTTGRQYWFNGETIIPGAPLYIDLLALNDSDGTTVTIAVVSLFGDQLEGVNIEIKRHSDNVTVSREDTDLIGEAKFFLNANDVYFATLSKSNFQTKKGIFSATQTTYTFTLEDDKSFLSTFYTNVSYEFSPSITDVIIPNTTTNFSFNISSSQWVITNCLFQVISNGTTLGSTNSWCGATAGFANLSVNSSTNSRLSAVATIELNGTNITISQLYTPIAYTQENFSLKTIVDDIRGFDKAGFNGFGRTLLVLIIIISSVLLLVSRLDTKAQPVTVLFLITIFVAIASYLNLLTITYGNIDGQYAILVVVGLATMLSLVMGWNT